MARLLVSLTVAMSLAGLSAGAMPNAQQLNRGVMHESLKDLRPEMKDVEEIVFVQRGQYADGHWYANIGYFCNDSSKTAYAVGAQLCKLNLKTGKVSVLLETDTGCIRDPHVHYDAKKLIFSYRKAGVRNYSLYEMNIDGGGLKQITSGPYDDYEPSYLPDGGIVFVSTRARRWVGCWKTHVGTIHRCDADGTKIRMISCNIEHDNTPAVLPDGRITYMRWEYVDRSQVEFHHLWVMNPDGSNQAIYYGNERSWGVFLGCRPIPGSSGVAGIYSPGHGRRDHYGTLTFFTDRHGPDDPRGQRHVQFTWGRATLADPWPLSKDCIIAADLHGPRIIVVEPAQKGKHTARVLYELKDNKQRKWIVQEPRPVVKRPRERVLAPRGDRSQATGRHVLIDVYNSQNMKGVKRGEITKLLILELLPKPVNFSGGPDTLTFLGTFNLEGILGTVPVEPDGSASFELPANRSVFYVALDKNDLSVKRMQSFTSVAPGETTSCLGCHEDRRQSSDNVGDLRRIMAMRREPSKIAPVEGINPVPDFARDVQPVLDKHCVKCHNAKDHKGKMSLAGDMGPTWSIPYYALIVRDQIADGRNGLGNRPPRTIGSSASPLLRRLEGGHNKVKASREDWRKVWAWIEAGAPFTGTYGALRNLADQDSKIWAFQRGANAVIGKRCYTCHRNDGKAPRFPAGFDVNSRRKHYKTPTGQHERLTIKNDPTGHYGWNVILNATRPERSAVVMAPLAKAAGGWGSCGPNVFRTTGDPDYKRMVAACRAFQAEWLKAGRVGSPTFRVNHQYVREMVRFGVLPPGTDPARVDPFATDRKYWDLFTYRPR